MLHLDHNSFIIQPMQALILEVVEDSLVEAVDCLLRQVTSSWVVVVEEHLCQERALARQ